MTELQRYEAVNKAETLQELAEVIRSFANDEGIIEGRTRGFDAERMARNCEMFDQIPPNALTRNYGIRQQALYIQYYNKR